MASQSSPSSSGVPGSHSSRRPARHLWEGEGLRAKDIQVLRMKGERRATSSSWTG